MPTRISHITTQTHPMTSFCHDLSDIISGELSHMHIVSDSRSVFDPQNTVFAALRTPLADGHRYIRSMYNAGVRHFIINDLPEGDFDLDATFYIIHSVQEALAEIATARLKRYHKGALVTGSIGKTTVKELIYRMLAEQTEVRHSPRSWNSSIGLPLAIADMTRDGNTDSVLVTEAGIDGPCQASAISRVVRFSHNVGVLTPLTAEHDEAFSSHRDKICEKLSVIDNCSTLVYDQSDPDLAPVIETLAPSHKLVPVTKGSHPSIFHALAAAAVEELGFDASAADTLPFPDKTRRIADAPGGNTIFRDNFTPDLRSLQDALDFMRRHTTRCKTSVLILGDIIGPRDEAERMARQFGIGQVLSSISEPITDSNILIFGQLGRELESAVYELEAAGHDTTLEVDLDALVYNFNHFRRLVPAGTGIIAMVKASAYGMGAIEIGKALQTAGAAALAVAVIEEGIALREAGITMPVIVLNPVTNRYPALFAHRLEPAVFSLEELDRLIAEAAAAGVENYPVHIKLDTGMHRVGFLPGQLDDIAERISRTGAVRIDSVFSHLATADCPDMPEYTSGQLELFAGMTDRLAKLTGQTFRRHILNTAGMMRYAGFGPYEMARLGIGLYGVSPFGSVHDPELHTVAAFRSHIISLKHWPEGTPIGYGCKGRTAGAESIIATVPAGYADGVNRRLGQGAASFVVCGVECPTIGNICMDLCMIDVTAVPDVAVGDEVEIFGPQMPVEHIAQVLGTIPYEVFTSVSPRVKRIYTKR